MVLVYKNLQKTGWFFGGFYVGKNVPAPFCSHMGEYWKIRHKTTVDGGEILPFQPPPWLNPLFNPNKMPWDVFSTVFNWDFAHHPPVCKENPWKSVFLIGNYVKSMKIYGKWQNQIFHAGPKTPLSFLDLSWPRLAGSDSSAQPGSQSLSTVDGFAKSWTLDALKSCN